MQPQYLYMIILLRKDQIDPTPLHIQERITQKLNDYMVVNGKQVVCEPVAHDVYLLACANPDLQDVYNAICSIEIGDDKRLLAICSTLMVLPVEKACLETDNAKLPELAGQRRLPQWI